LLQAFFDGHPYPYLRFGTRNLSTQVWKGTAYFWMKDMKGTWVVTRCDVIPLLFALRQLEITFRSIPALNFLYVV
jgi:hypothetical protein